MEAESETNQTETSGRGGSPKVQGGKKNAGATAHPRGANAGAFISYIAVRSEDEEADPDGLAHESRMTLEEQAIEIILKSEPGWQRTPPNNPGYDLIRSDEQGQTEYCEVKGHDRDT